MADDRTILIIGGGVAGGTTASTLREEGFEGRVVLVTDEPHPPYERPPVSKGLLSGDADVSDATMRTTDDWREQDVEVLTDTRVVSIDPDRGSATLADGTELTWDDLVLATGASARPSPIDGSSLPGAHTLRTIEDALVLRAALRQATTAVIIGSSWIGLEAAAAARGHDCGVVVVGRDDEPLQGVLGPEVGRAFRALHEDHGVVFRTGTDVDVVLGSDRATGVRLTDGEELEADVVVLGTGVQPVVDLAEEAGLVLDDDLGGVQVDAQLRTSHPHVYAVGDIAAHDHPRLGRLRVEHVEVARGHGATVAAVLTGQDVEHDELPLFYSDQYDVGMEYVGHGPPDDVVIREGVPDRPVVAFYLDDDVVVAGAHADEWDATDVVRSLIGDRVDRAVLADADVPLDELADRARMD